MGGGFFVKTMECLRNTIGPFQGCGAPTPTYGKYLSSLPGIEFANIDQIATADQVTWQGVWNDLQDTCVDTFREDVITEFGKRYLLKQITQTVDLGQNINTSNTTAPAAGITNGILAELMEPGSQCIGSNLMGMYVQSVMFYWQGTDPNPTFTLTFKDADLLTTEYTVTPSTVTAGWNTVLIDRNFNARRLYVLASGNFDDYVELDLSLFNLDNFGSLQWGYSNLGYLNFSFTYCGIQARINGVSFNSNNNTYTKGTNTFGMSMIFSTKCSWDSVVCANKAHFLSAWQHRLAIELMNYRINTTRINRWVTIDNKQAQKLQTLFAEKYYGGELYPIGKLQSAIESLAINDADGCIRSNDYLMWRESHP